MEDEWNADAALAEIRELMKKHGERVWKDEKYPAYRLTIKDTTFISYDDGDIFSCENGETDGIDIDTGVFSYILEKPTLCEDEEEVNDLLELLRATFTEEK